MSCEDEDEFWDLELLPDHVLMKILLNLNVDDLKNVMLLNSFFYKFILNSRFLNNKISLRIVKVMADESKYSVDDILESLIASSRIFTDVKLFWRGYIISDSSPLIARFFQVYGQHIKIFQIANSAVNSHFLAFLLHAMPNVENLIYKVQIVQIPDRQYVIPVVFNLKTLDVGEVIHHPNSFLNLFNSVTSLESVKLSYGINGVFQNLLCRQPNLNALVFSERFSSGGGMFEQDISNLCKFQLKTLNFLYTWVEEQKSNVAKFLRSQLKLEELTMNMGYSTCQLVMQAIISLPKLRKLDIYLRCLDGSIPENLLGHNSNVQTLKLATNHIKRAALITNSLPAITSLDLDIRELSANGVIEDISFKHLNKLKHFKSSVQGLSMLDLINPQLGLSSITVLELTNVEGLPEWWQTFVEKNPRITSINLNGCQISDEILEVIAKNLKNLNKFFGFQINPLWGPNAIKTICDNCTELEFLELTVMDKKEVFEDVLLQFEEKLSKINCIFKFDEEVIEYESLQYNN